jgi:hypothetical protein
MDPERTTNLEELRLDEAREKGVAWKQCGPYLSERQWGTVREDYSENGDAWNCFTHDQARSRAYRWGEDGLAAYYGDSFKIECPTGSGILMNLFEVAREIANRLTRIFLRDAAGRRPVFGGAEKFQRDPSWRDHLLFYEYFHGDNGAGHQTGWTGVIALLIEIFGKFDAQTFLQGGREAAFGRERERV